MKLKYATKLGIVPKHSLKKLTFIGLKSVHDSYVSTYCHKMNE